jgi:thiol:disulfide interchange protein DsbA
MGTDTLDFPGRAARAVPGRLISNLSPAVWAGLAAVALCSPEPAGAQDPAAPAGRSEALPYRDLMSSADPIRLGGPGPARRVWIVAFFDDDCAGCSALAADLVKWERALPSAARLVRVPATYSATGMFHARAFYTATKLGKLAELRAALGQRGGERFESVDELAALFERFGIEREAFADAFDSLEVQIEIDRAAHQTRQYGVTVVPTMVVGARYLTTVEIAGSTEAMLAAARERVEALLRGCRGAGCRPKPF